MMPFLLDFDIMSKFSAYSLKLIINSGSSGVEMFFVISGYLITGSLLRHKNVSSFLMDRAIRIYPVFLSIHIPLFIILPFIGWKWLSGIDFSEWLLYFLSNILFLPGIFELKILQTNAWTLSYELLFYLLSCVIYACLRCRSGFISKLLLALGVAFVLYVYPRGIYFLVGTVLYFTLRKDSECGQSRFLNPDLLFLLVLVLLGPCRSSIGVVGNPIHSTDIMTKLAVIPLFFMFMGVVRSKGFLSLFLRTNIMQYFGKISYSLYLWHAVILSIGNKIFVSILLTKLGWSPGIALFVLVSLEIILTVIISHISYKVFELRFANWLKSKKSKLKLKRVSESASI